MKVVIEMKLTKSTKGTHVYSNVEADIAIPSLYIKKAALPNQPPETIKVSIEHD